MNPTHLPATTRGLELTHLMVRLEAQARRSASMRDPQPEFLDAALVATQARAWMATLRLLPQTHWAIYEPHPQRFAAMLFGAWHAAKTVVVVPHTRPSMLRALAQLGCGYLGTFPPPLAALCEPTPAPDTLPELGPLCADAKISLFTSGSTGEPTRIDKTLQHFAAECDALEAVLGATMQRQPLVTSATHQHIYGLLYCIFWPLAAGRPVYLKRLSGAPWDFPPGSRPTVVTTPTALRQLQAAGGPAPAASPATAYKMAVAAPPAANIAKNAPKNTAAGNAGPAPTPPAAGNAGPAPSPPAADNAGPAPSPPAADNAGPAPSPAAAGNAEPAAASEVAHLAPLTAGLIISSGGPLPPALAAWAQQHLGCPVVELLGSTETGGIAYRQAGNLPAPWTALPQVLWRIDRGSLSVCSPFVYRAGYFRTADRAAAVPRASAARSTTFELLGRADRILKIHEKAVSLAEVESILSAHPGVARAVALSLQPQPCAAPKIAVVIEPADEKLASPEDLSAFLRRQVISAAVPDPQHWRVISQWPAANGLKTTQQDLLDLF
jgi:hypothetical protein